MGLTFRLQLGGKVTEPETVQPRWVSETLYPRAWKNGGLEVSGYRPIIQYFGETIVEEWEAGYQGDTFAFIRKDERVGFLFFSWGSCSGCDALRACESYEEIDRLMERLRGSIRWYGSVQEAQEWLRGHEAELQCYGYSDAWVPFYEKVMACGS